MELRPPAKSSFAVTSSRNADFKVTVGGEQFTATTELWIGVYFDFGIYLFLTIVLSRSGDDLTRFTGILDGC